MESLIRRRDFEITSTPGFTEWAHEQKISFAISTYRVGAVLLLGSYPDGTPSLQTAAFDRAMGLCCLQDALWLVTQRMIWRFQREIDFSSAENPRSHDYVYVPRLGYPTGEIDGHEIAMSKNQGPVFVNTRFNCLATVDPEFNFKPLWQPDFISELVPEDRCHLSGLAIRAGKPKYVTMHAKSNQVQGWRDSRITGGLVMDVDSHEVIAESLSMPHSPRWENGDLWILNSGTGHFGRINQESGNFEPLSFVPGFARGLSFHSKYAVIGLSKPRREHSFHGLPLERALEEHNRDACCGLEVIDIETGESIHRLRIESSIMELFDVTVLPETRCPRMLSFTSSNYAHRFSFQHHGELHQHDAPSSNLATLNPQEASSAFQATFTEDPADMMAPRHLPEKTAKALNNLGLLHVQQGNMAEAHQCFDQAVTIDPKHAGAWNNLGNIFQKQNRLDDAITCYRKSVAADAKYVRAFFNLARAYEAKGETSEARKLFRKTLEIDPNHLEAKNAMKQR